MKLSKGAKTALWIGIPLAIAITIAILVNRKPKTPLTDVDPKNPPPPKKSVTPSDFPIKRGSRGELVGQLQEYLGVASDKIFGPKTEAALKAKTGKTSIGSQSEYDATINKMIADLAAAATASARGAASSRIVTDYNANDSYKMTTLKSFSARRYNKDVYGTFSYVGPATTVKPDVTFDRSSIQMESVSGDGFIRAFVTDHSSTLPSGYYLFDPSEVTLVNS